MTATEKLMALLDERGVKYETHDIIVGKAVTWTGSVCNWVALPDEKGLAVGVYKDYLTPEQAIAATLGRGTCRWFYPQGANGWLGYTECSNCGYRVYENTIDEREFVYCPQCGEKVNA